MGICNSSCHCQNVIEILHWKWSERWIMTRKSIWGLFKARGQHWTEPPYLSLLPLDKRTPRAHTGYRDKIQQELPSAEHCWVIFLRTAWVKKVTRAFLKQLAVGSHFRIFLKWNTGPILMKGWVSVPNKHSSFNLRLQSWLTWSFTQPVWTPLIES